MNLRRYLDVLRAPGVARLAVFTFAGRLPFAIVGLSMILLMRRETYSYGEIGSVLAAKSIAAPGNVMIELTAEVFNVLNDDALMQDDVVDGVFGGMRRFGRQYQLSARVAF